MSYRRRLKHEVTFVHHEGLALPFIDDPDPASPNEDHLEREKQVILSELGVSIAPILGAAGVVGLAVGFGAQSLIKDFFAGFMILLEDQYNVGDTVKIGETSGTVERLTLRMTLIRALDGSLTIIPNGTITTVSNFSKDWSRAVLDFLAGRAPASVPSAAPARTSPSS